MHQSSTPAPCVVSVPSDGKRDFIPADELSQLTARKIKTIYDDHSRGVGPLAEILTKFGGRVGVWRKDYDAFIDRQRKLRDAA